MIVVSGINNYIKQSKILVFEGKKSIRAKIEINNHFIEEIVTTQTDKQVMTKSGSTYISVYL
jgi:hypothetical protein